MSVLRDALSVLSSHFLIIYLFTCIVHSACCKAEFQPVCGSLWLGTELELDAASCRKTPRVHLKHVFMQSVFNHIFQSRF